MVAFTVGLVRCEACRAVLAEPTEQQGASYDLFYEWCRTIPPIARREGWHFEEPFYVRCLSCSESSGSVSRKTGKS